jgi:AmmeMemoRadiSam system protein B
MVPAELAGVLQLLDGSHSRQEIDRIVKRDLDGSVPKNFVEDLLGKLDSVYLLDTPRYRTQRTRVIQDYCQKSVRPASHAGGAYESDPVKLRQQIRGMFAGAEGPGHPGPFRGNDLKGIFSPHIDFRRGGSSFAYGFKELAERTNARTFVIIATSHYSMHRFILSKKDYETPLGIAKTDQDFVDRLVEHYGSHCFEDEYATRPEHSVEFQVLFLQYLFEGKRDFRIVPLLVGSFHDAVEQGREPADHPDIGRMIEALRMAEAASTDGVCFVCSGDLAHIGMKFGDPWSIDSNRSAWCRGEDLALVSAMETGDPTRLFEMMVGNRDERRICGFPPAYVMFHAMGKTAGKKLCYDQFVDPRGYEIVSFASMAFGAAT